MFRGAYHKAPYKLDMRKWLVVCVLASALLPITILARTIDFPDLRRQISFSDPQFAPDGRTIVYVRSRADFAQDTYDVSLMLLDVRSRNAHPLTYDHRGIAMPRWSPAGSRVAFLALAKSGDDEQEQIFVMRVDGGDPRRVTDAPNGVESYAWSPDGRRIAYITQDKNPSENLVEQHLDAFEVRDNDFLHTSATMPSHLWLINADGGSAHRLSNGSWSLATSDPDQLAEPSWCPNGRTIAVVRFPTPIYGDSLGSIVELIDSKSGSIKRLTNNDGLENAPLFAPHGFSVAYQRNTAGDFMNGVALYVTGRPGMAGRDVRRSIDRNVTAAVWTRDARALWLQGQSGTDDMLWYVPLAGAPHSAALGDVEPVSLGNTGRNGAVVFVGATKYHPQELYMLASPVARPVQLTNDNRFVSSLNLGRTVSVRWRSDGYNEDGILTYPPHYVRGKKYPLVLYIHEGPQEASTRSWDGQRQLFASHGYLVFQPNYRGSTNLGDRYQHAITRDTGAGPARDVMAGITEVERSGAVDSRRIAVSGWSYGGFMTSWLIGHYNIWKAAVSGAALNDWLDDYNVSFYYRTDLPFFGGSPWDPQYESMWREQSPITYAKSIKTPTLIMGDVSDNNVPITNSFKMFHALKDNGVPTEFVAYPVDGHHPFDPVRNEDTIRRWLAWLDRYLLSGT